MPRNQTTHRFLSLGLALTIPMGVAWTQVAPPRPAASPKRVAVAAKPAGPQAPQVDPAAAQDAARTWALLIGIGKYANPSVAALRYPADDAASIRAALVDKGLGGVPEDHVKLLVDDQATGSAIFGAVDSFLASGVKAGDRVIVFLAGHGVAKGVGTGAKSYFLPHDITGYRKEQLEASGVDLKKLADKLAALPAAQFVILVDACREDPIPGRGVKGNLLPDTMRDAIQLKPRAGAAAGTIFACAVGQRAFEDPEMKHGVFTYNILEGVKKAADPTTGQIDLGRFFSFVKAGVESWAKKTSESGAFDVEQTPEFVSNLLPAPVTLLRLQSVAGVGGSTAAPQPPTLFVGALPEGAQVQVNGKPVGAAPIAVSLPGPGDYKVSLQAPGFAPLERDVKAFAGYGMQVDFALPPGARGVGGAPATGPAAEFYAKAVAAEQEQNWDVAHANYLLSYSTDPTFGQAYEGEADLYRHQNRDLNAIETLAKQVQKVESPPARAYALLARAYAVHSLETRLTDPEETQKADAARKKDDNKKGGLDLGKVGGGIGGLFGKKKKEAPKEDKPAAPSDSGLTGPARFVRPATWTQAAELAGAAAEEASKIDASTADALLGRGFALLATENLDKKKPQNRQKALEAFEKAVANDPQSADAQFGLGYGLRFYAQDGDAKDAEADLDRAIEALKAAIALRPNFYEAHRELAFCYHLRGDLPKAKRAYEQADAHRSGASSEDEIAAVNLSLGAVTQQMASAANGDRRAGLELASKAYFTDAKEISPNLENALRILAGASLGSRMLNFLPDELRNPMRKIDDMKRDILNKIKIPDPGRLLRFP